MTKKELIEALQKLDCPDNAEVHCYEMGSCLPMDICEVALNEFGDIDLIPD